ncbi:MAG TPA: hypothetical protein DC042_15055 [Bacteroidales bacterium]|nr:hypothetical protein [Bacteroidales bacterium]
MKPKKILKIYIFFLMLFSAFLFGCEKDVAQTYSFKQVGTIQGPAESIASIAVSPDGRMIAYGTYADNLIRIADAGTFQEIRTLAGHIQPVTGLAFSPNSNILASTGTVFLGDPRDGVVRLWNIATGAELASVETAPAGISQLAFSQDGSMLAGAEGGGGSLQVRIWNANNLSEIRTISGMFRMVALSPDGSRIATGKRDDQVYIMDVTTGNQITSFGGHTGWIESVAFSQNGQVLATGGEDRLINIRNPQNGQITGTLTGHTSYPDFLEFNPDGSLLSSVGSGTNITRTGGGISFSLSSEDKLLRIWDLEAETEFLPRVNTGTDVINGVSFSEDWSVLVTGSESGLIRIFHWEAESSVLPDPVLTALKSIRNHPNPFPGITTIEYQLLEPGKVSLIIYDYLGQPVTNLVNEVQPQGRHQVEWNADELPSGLYFGRLTIGQRAVVHKILKN